MKYYVSQGLLHPPLEIEIDGVPPCLFCDAPVSHPSMNGPFVCGPCDMGCHPDGTRWTPAESRARHEHYRAKIAAYRGSSEGSSEVVDIRIENRPVASAPTSTFVEYETPCPVRFAGGAHPTDVECPTCGAWVGWACKGDDYGYHGAGYHPERSAAAEARQGK